TTPPQTNPAVASWTQQVTDRISRCETVDDFVAVLNALTDPDQRRFVVDCALGRFMKRGAIDDLARQVRNDPGLRLILVQQLLKYATHPEKLRSAYVRGSRVALPTDPPDLQRRKEFASRCAAAVFTALDEIPPRELGKFLSSLLQDDGTRFALALGGEHS